MFKPPPQNFICGHPVIYLDQVASTNDYAKQKLADNDITSQTIVFAKSQTMGKGRRGNYWYSEAGKDLVFSFVMPGLSMPVENKFWLTKFASISIIETLKKYKPNGSLSIKWPNDIFIDDQKIAGILIENSIQSNLVESSVLGIGINLNQEKNVENGISLSQRTLHAIPIFEILEEIIQKMNRLFKKSFEQSDRELSLGYKSNLYGIGREIEFGFQESRQKGIFQEVTDAGDILIMQGGISKYFSPSQVDKLTFL